MCLWAAQAQHCAALSALCAASWIEASMVACKQGLVCFCHRLLMWPRASHAALHPPRSFTGFYTNIRCSLKQMQLQPAPELPSCPSAGQSWTNGTGLRWGWQSSARQSSLAQGPEHVSGHTTHSACLLLLHAGQLAREPGMWHSIRAASSHFVPPGDGQSCSSCSRELQRGAGCLPALLLSLAGCK